MKLSLNTFIRQPFFKLFTTLSLLSFSSMAQNKIRPLEQLINKEDPAWPLVKEWADSAKNKVEILPADKTKAETALYNTQVTTRSPMGSIVYMTGGILIDNGWIRILGSGHTKLTRSLPEWNKGKTFQELGQAPGFLLIADDAAGGFFLLNGGGLGTDLGKVYYFSPDNLKYEATHLSYTEFLDFCFNSNLDEFYKGLRWSTWRADLTKLKGDQCYNFYPMLWTKEGEDINKCSKKIVPIEEQYGVNMSARKQLGIGN
jgi:hypothetical protein